MIYTTDAPEERLRFLFARVAVFAIGTAFTVGVIGACYVRTDVAAMAALSAVVQERELAREIRWWTFASVLAAGLTLLTCLLLELRRAWPLLAPRVATSLALLILFASSGYAVDAYVQSFRSQQSFECIITGAALLWSPAVAAACAGVSYGFLMYLKSRSNADV